MGALQESLRRREILRESNNLSETVVFDNGQRVTRERLSMPVERELAAVSGSQSVDVIRTIKVNARSGNVDVSHPRGGHGDFSGPKTGYPELSSFLSLLDAGIVSHPKQVDPASNSEIRAVLAGHGNVAPWHLLKPEICLTLAELPMETVVETLKAPPIRGLAALLQTEQADFQEMLESFRGECPGFTERGRREALPSEAVLAADRFMLGDDSVDIALIIRPEVAESVKQLRGHPYVNEPAFSLQTLKKDFEQKGACIAAADVTPAMDKYVACIAPDSILAMGDDPNYPSALEIVVFNAKKLSETPKDDRALVMPEPGNTLFKISYFFNNAQTPPMTSFTTYEYAQSKFDAVNSIDLTTIQERWGRFGVFIKVDREFVELLARLAPLPIESSDCGAALGFPELNQNFDRLVRQAYPR